jgi:uncharacterized membrane protein YoaK (UPF0700 family)
VIWNFFLKISNIHTFLNRDWILRLKNKISFFLFLVFGLRILYFCVKKKNTKSAFHISGSSGALQCPQFCAGFGLKEYFRKQCTEKKLDSKKRFSGYLGFFVGNCLSGLSLFPCPFCEIFFQV